MEQLLSFGEWLAQRRKLCFYTQTSLAQAIACSASLIRKYEQNKRYPSADIARLLAEKLQIHPDLQDVFIDVARGLRPIIHLPTPEQAASALFVSEPDQLTTWQKIPEFQGAMIGREAECTRLLELLTQASVRLISLTGLSGIGKTRLARAVLQQLTPEIYTHVDWINLQSMSTTEAFWGVLAQLLKVDQQPFPIIKTHIQHAFGSQKRLFIFDSLEHAIPLLEHVIPELLAMQPQLTLLLTCRKPFGFLGETIIPIRPLPTAAPDIQAEQWQDDPALALWLQCLAQQSVQVQHTAAEITRHLLLCQKLEGLPLAMEAAALRLRKVGLAHVLQELADPKRILYYPRETTLLHQQTLYQAIKCSYDMVAPAAQHLLQQLAHTAHPFDLNVITACCVEIGIEQPSQIIDLIEILVDTNLLVEQHHESVPRFNMLDCMRAFAREQAPRKG